MIEHHIRGDLLIIKRRGHNVPTLAGLVATPHKGSGEEILLQPNEVVVFIRRSGLYLQLEEHCGFLGLMFASYPQNELLSCVKYNMFMSDKKIGLNIVDGETLCVLFPEFLLYNKLEVAARPWFIDDDGELWTRADGPNAPENCFLKLVEPPPGKDWIIVPSSQVSFVKC